jgi:hypothetical protein
LWAAASGLLPLLLCALLGSSLHQPLAAIAVFCVVLASALNGRVGEGLAALALAFGVHCAAGIVLARFWPELAATCFPGGEAYWANNLVWIRTGVDPEYEPLNWVPAHAQLVGAVGLLGYLSMGLIPLFQGFHEVDLMNFYVGRLLAGSNDSVVSLLLGWHPWSVARGLGFCLLVYELAAFSSARFVGRPASPLKPALMRVGLGLTLLLVDGLLKWQLLETVRGALDARLLEHAS